MREGAALDLARTFLAAGGYALLLRGETDSKEEEDGDVGSTATAHYR